MIFCTVVRLSSGARNDTPLAEGIWFPCAECFVDVCHILPHSKIALQASRLTTHSDQSQPYRSLLKFTVQSASVGDPWPVLHRY